MTAPAETAGLPPHTLLKLQAPIETFSNFIDGHLQHWFPVRPVLVWTLHLLLAIILTVLVAWAVGWMCRTAARFAARRQRRMAAALLDVAAPTLGWMVLLGGIADALEDAWPQVKGPVHWLSGSLFVLSTVIATRGGVRLLRLLLDWVLRPSMNQQRDGLSSGGRQPHATANMASSAAILPLVQRLASILVWLVGVILVLDHFGQNVSSVVAAFGVTSLAIGLAAQQALSNIIAGLVLAVDHPFRPGDRIKLASGEAGEVIETGMRATHIRLADGSLLVVPNAELVSSRIVNQSTETLVRAEIRVTAPTTVDVERLSRELGNDATSAADPEPLPLPPRVQLMSVASDKVELSLILWLPRGIDVAATEEALRRSALKRLLGMVPPVSIPTMTLVSPGSPAPAAPAPPPQAPPTLAQALSPPPPQSPAPPQNLEKGS